MTESARASLPGPSARLPRRDGVKLRRFAGIGAVGAAAVALFVVSRGKWSEPLIDSGREWIVPDALARGELLYRDVVYWFGPLTPYVQAAFLRVFGSNFASLVVAGAVSAVAGARPSLPRTASRDAEARGGALDGSGDPGARLHAQRRRGAARDGIPHLARRGVRAGRRGDRLLAERARSARRVGRRRRVRGPRRPVPHGVGSGHARGRRPRRASAARDREARDRRAALAVAGWASGLRRRPRRLRLEAGATPVIADGHVLLTGLPARPGTFCWPSPASPDWRSGLAELVYSAAMWSALFLVAALLSRPSPSRRGSRSRPRGGARDPRGRRARSAAPAARRSLQRGAPRLPGGAGGGRPVRDGSPRRGPCGLRASRASPSPTGGLFHIGDSAYVGPPLLFAFVCAAGLLWLAASRWRGDRRDPRGRLTSASAMGRRCARRRRVRRPARTLRVDRGACRLRARTGCSRRDPSSRVRSRSCRRTIRSDTQGPAAWSSFPKESS